MKESDDANPNGPPLTPGPKSQPKQLRGFRRGVRDGFRYSRPFALILGSTAAAYTFLPIAGPKPPLSFDRLLFGYVFVAIYFAAIPLVWCLCAGVVASLQDWRN